MLCPGQLSFLRKFSKYYNDYCIESQPKMFFLYHLGYYYAIMKVNVILN